MRTQLEVIDDLLAERDFNRVLVDYYRAYAQAEALKASNAAKELNILKQRRVVTSA